MEEVLVFFSGADRVPPLGFSRSTNVSFLYGQTSRFCTASTCEIYNCLLAMVKITRLLEKL